MARPFPLAFLAGVAIASLACSSTIDVGEDGPPAPGPGSGTVAGTDDGHPLAARDAIGEVSNSGTIHSLWVTISDRGNMCGAFRDGAESFANATLLRLDLMSDPPSGQPLTLGTGTYALGSQTATKPRFSARFIKTDASCNNVVGSNHQDATGGTLTISEVGASAITGTFELTFSNGALQGSFRAVRCGAPSTGAGRTCAL